jgi:hypothetical protein
LEINLQKKKKKKKKKPVTAAAVHLQAAFRGLVSSVARAATTGTGFFVHIQVWL